MLRVRLGIDRAPIDLHLPNLPNSSVHITIAIRLRYDYDEKLTCSLFARVESRRMEAGARAIRRSRIVVESQLYNHGIRHALVPSFGSLGVPVTKSMHCRPYLFRTHAALRHTLVTFRVFRSKPTCVLSLSTSSLLPGKPSTYRYLTVQRINIGYRYLPLRAITLSMQTSALYKSLTYLLHKPSTDRHLPALPFFQHASFLCRSSFRLSTFQHLLKIHVTNVRSIKAVTIVKHVK